MECFHYDTLEEEQLRRLHCLEPERRACRDGSVWKSGWVLPSHPIAFSIGWSVAGKRNRWIFPSNGGFQVAIVVNGEGKILSRGGDTALRQGERFLPARSDGRFSLCSNGKEPFEVLLCYPPHSMPVPPQED